MSQHTEKMMNNEEYIDQDTNAVLDQKIMRQSWLRMLWVQASFNYQRMQSSGFLYAMLPALQRIHKNKHDLSLSLKLHNEFFNTAPWLVTFMQGVILAMEKGKQPIETIRSFKVAAMGPLGGIGDAMCQLTILPITASIAAALALDKVYIAPLIFLLLFNLVRFSIYIPLFNYGYKLGLNALGSLKQQSDAFSRGATILGLTVVGALTASFVRVKLGAEIHLGDTVLNIQDGILDKIMPNILPLIVVIVCYKLIMRGLSPVKMMLGMIVGSVLLHYVGIL
ncbi:PTS system mannose/fructose/sorbose family transporter subunit IID [Aeromonas veronii]|uniref:PTS system mannose/fructose/sorbose family transporter subunit IID n=1 Tax=Aeromonas veronii TaxID=654 RepID=UPI001926EB29|nr:PTS system mannose/fructose/sorbose family transporter subunit IID [Aeromonas veronii]MCJ7977569.1 PTS system mannose/fructose/sorbose family transporter subunit IID [Aeromonas veronii]UOR17838.1 PTS system mannose/fructose/sorbose family transporter subunit IID [Aeromonas veronii]